MGFQLSTGVDSYLFEPFCSAATLLFRHSLVHFLGPCSVDLSRRVKGEKHHEDLPQITADGPVMSPPEKGQSTI